MIISHKYKFIFIKTVKTAGTSIEVFLSQYCGENDVLTPIVPHVDPHVARNHRGFWNPVPQMLAYRGRYRFATLKRFFKRRKFFNHISAEAVRATVPANTWNGYFKFCVERNPWDKVLSSFSMYQARGRETATLDDFLRSGRLPFNYPLYLDHHDKLLVDEIIHYESLMESLGRVFGKLEIPYNGTLGANAKSEHRKDRAPYQQVYTEAQKETVARLFAKEIKLNGYVF